MNCAEAMLSCIKGNIRCKKLILRKNLEIAFSCIIENKVKLYSKPSAMEDLYDPPSGVRGMTKLDRNAFKKTINVPCVTTGISSVEKAKELLKKFSLNILRLPPLQKIENDRFRFLIDKKIISSWNDFDKNTQENLESINISKEDFSEISVELEYKNWSADALMKAILPEDVIPLKKFSVIGHIIHLNLRDELLDYRHIIGELLLDKLYYCKTVVCKKNIIDNVYRNFEMELLVGEPNFIASVSENNCRFELDFSKVYWNPRLTTEHHRIVETISGKDVLFDVFAGVGPFAIPAAKKFCTVFANDLNPESVKWLEHNIGLNKKTRDYITIFNKDGKDFILNDVKENLIKTWQDDLFVYKIHVVMNLPQIAPTFMKYFYKLISQTDLVNMDISQVKKCLPIINCYFFKKDGECEKTIFEEASEMNLSNIEHSFHCVRTVSPGKAMISVTFTLPFDYLVGEKDGTDITVEPDEPLSKRICIG